MVDYGLVCHEYFYQVGLTDFGNYGEIKLNPPLDIRQLIEIAARYDAEKKDSEDTAMGGTQEDTTDVDDIVENATELLISRAAMLLEYFAISITEDGNLESLPLLVM